MKETEVAENRQIARSAGLVMGGFVLSNILGLLNRMLYLQRFGTSPEMDAFYAANRLPTTLFFLMAGGALASAFIPTFTELLTRGNREAAWKLASSLTNLILISVGSAALLCSWFAPWIVRNLLVPGYQDPTRIQLTIDLLRIQLLSPVLFSVSGLLMGVLNAHQHFLLPAIAPAFNWLGWILGVLLLSPRWGIFGLAWGVVLGAALHLGIQLPGLRGRQAKFHLILGLKDPYVKEVGRLMPPRVLALAVVQVNFWVIVILASTMPVGSQAGVENAFALMTMPQVVIAQAVAIAALPTFSAQIARGESDAMRRSLTGTLRGVLFLSLPASVGLMMLREPLTTALFQRGSFTAASTDLVAWPLLWFSAGLLGHALLEIIVRAFYAMKDTKTPALIGAGAMVLNVILSLLLSNAFHRLGWPPHGGLALANSLATALESVVLLAIMGGRLKGLPLPRFRHGLLPSLLATLLMAGSLGLWLRVSETWNPILIAGGGVALGGGLYWISAFLLRAPEARDFPKLIFQRGHPEG